MYIPKAELRKLRNFQGDGAVSIYAPAIPVTAGTNPNTIQLKNLMKEAERMLLDSGLRVSDVKQRTAPIEKLLKGRDFAAHTATGLIIFSHPKHFASFRAPIKQESVSIGERFNLDPLETLVKDTAQFYVLAFSQNSVRLLEGDDDKLQPAEVPRLPVDMQSALQLDEIEVSTQNHNITRGEGGAPEGFHGHGGVKDQKDSLLEGFCREVDRHIGKFMQNKDVPLIFAGVEYEFALYKKFSQALYLLDSFIKGNPDRKHPEQLHKEALRVLQGS